MSSSVSAPRAEIDRDSAERLHVLVSFAYWGKPSATRLLADLPQEWNFMLDSGAFTNFTSGVEKITLPDYIAYCKANDGMFWRTINLDKIGDSAVSMSNCRAMHAAGVKAIPVFQRGESPAALAEMAELATPVCIGGISQNLDANVEKAYLRSCMKAARQLGVEVHLLGVGAGRLLTAYQPWSADSSSWTAATRFGKFCARSRDRVTWFSKITNRDAASPDYIRPKLEKTRVLREYGLTWDDLRDAKAWSRHGKVHIAHVRSCIRLARALARANVRYIFATNAGLVPSIVAAWDLEKHKWP